MKKNFFLNTDIYIYISILVAGLIFSCQVENFDDPKPTHLSEFMNGFPNSLLIGLGDQVTTADDDFKKKVLEKVEAKAKYKAEQAVQDGKLSKDDQATFTEKFKPHILDLVYNGEEPKPKEGTITISARNMRTLTSYDWAREKTIKLEITYNQETDPMVYTRKLWAIVEIAAKENAEKAKVLGLNIQGKASDDEELVKDKIAEALNKLNYISGLKAADVEIDKPKTGEKTAAITVESVIINVNYDEVEA